MPVIDKEPMIRLEVTDDEAWEIHCALDAAWTALPAGSYRSELLMPSNRVRDAMEPGT